MKPSSKSGEIATLNTRPEGEVVLAYINSVHYLQQQPGFAEAMRTGIAHAKESENAFADRFFYNATVFDSDRHRTEVRNYFTFPVYASERDVIVAAAKRVLDSKNPIRQLLDRKSGRTAAARTMLNFFSHQ